MNISLEGESEQIIRHLVQTGGYASASAAVDDAVRQHAQRLGALQAKLDASMESGEASESEVDEWLAGIMEELKREGL